MIKIGSTVRETVKEVNKLGCVVSQSANSHYRVTYDGHLVGSLACSPSDPRSMLNSFKSIARRVRIYKQTGRTW